MICDVTTGPAPWPLLNNIKCKFKTILQNTTVKIYDCLFIIMLQVCKFSEINHKYSFLKRKKSFGLHLQHLEAYPGSFMVFVLEYRTGGQTITGHTRHLLTPVRFEGEAAANWSSQYTTFASQTYILIHVAWDLSGGQLLIINTSSKKYELGGRSHVSWQRWAAKPLAYS